MAKRKAVDKQDKILKAVEGLTQVVQQLVNLEVNRSGSTDHGSNGLEGVQSVSSVRKNVAQARVGAPVARRAGEDVRPRRDAGSGLEARKRAEEAALNQGVENAVSSYRPANDPIGLPPRNVQVKVLYGADEPVFCSECKEQIYVTLDEITTAHTVKDLVRLLDPYSEAYAKLTEDTPVDTKGGVRMPCPRCEAPWGVVVL